MVTIRPTGPSLQTKSVGHRMMAPRTQNDGTQMDTALCLFTEMFYLFGQSISFKRVEAVPEAYLFLPQYVIQNFACRQHSISIC